MKPVTTFLIALIVSLGVALPAAAKDTLGVRIVDYGIETDVVPVPGTKRYGEVQLCVHQRPVHFRDLDIVFGNGGRMDATIRRVIGRGECTRWIDLGPARRNIREIIMKYDSINNSGPRAKVTIYGR